MSRRLLLVLVAALTVSGCLRVYQQEIQQGNVVDQEMIDKLKPGMTRAQVRFVLGTPLLTDSFHADRWDYVYFYKKSPAAPAETRRLTVFFQGDTLARLEGDVVTAAPPPASAAGRDESTRPTIEEPAQSSRAL